MKRVLSLSIVLLLAVQSFAQTYIALVKPDGSKTWGYTTSNGEMIIKPISKRCVEFSEEGLALYYEKPNFKIINIQGEIIPSEIKEYRVVELFGFGMKGYSNGLLAINDDGKWGYLDTEGKTVITPQYDKVSVFTNDKAIARKDDKFFILDISGSETKVDIPGLIDLDPFEGDGLAPYRLEDKTWGFINADGTVAIKAQFGSVGYFSDGLAWARGTSGLIGFIDTSGQWVIEPQFQSAKEFDPSSGLARIKRNDQWGYTNKSGEIIRINDTEKWEDFSDGLALGRKNDKFGFFDVSGQWAIEPQYDGARSFYNGFAAVKKGDLWGYINTKGEWVIEPKFSGVKDFQKIN
ncbi:WG containing repeat-containing protein [Reichenbachiella agariperforans]|uniref:WG containing repeat-containing protein n=1 Tax=Reichenbachiella agariperforans TaxID=156994 RepID=A0A1M6M7A1_REIAG|nr:WG repeat-containing protein [Reichenbachiella agariperforans]SHJ79270.1 WG containing repeat-containing protein [Reichenbachiella agariperforans]